MARTSGSRSTFGIGKLPHALCASALGIKAMKIPSNRVHMLSFDVKVKAPEVHHSISSASLGAWLTQNGKTPKEQTLKSRLNELLRA